jgi:hypothetical protein
MKTRSEIKEVSTAEFIDVIQNCHLMIFGKPGFGG